jgi:ABC-type multidrug transport system ATPase subunit
MSRKITHRFNLIRSAGLDPFSKRKLWKLIQQHVAKYRTSVILTTHDMDEAANLSDEISMLINGQIVVNDTVQALIDKFGNAYEISIKTKVGREEAIRYVQAKIPYSKVVEARKDN